MLFKNYYVIVIKLLYLTRSTKLNKYDIIMLLNIISSNITKLYFQNFIQSNQQIYELEK